MYAIKLLLKNGFKLAVRKKFVLVSMIIFPVLSTFLILFGGSGSVNFNRTSILLYIKDSNIYSDTIKESLEKDSVFDIYNMAEKDRDNKITVEEQFKKYANSSPINIFVTIPSDIESRIQTGKAAYIIYDTGNDEKMSFLKSYLDPVVLRLKLLKDLSGGNEAKLISMLKDADNSSLKETLKDTSVSSTDDKSNNSDAGNKFSLVMGFFSWFAIWGSSYVISMIMRERDMKVFKRIMLTNTGIRKYLTSKLLIGVLIGITQVILMLISFKFLVHADVVIPLWKLGILLFGFIIVAITINLALVSFCSTENQVSTLSIIVVNVTAMLSGSYWPLELMPQWMKNLSFFTPQRWVMHAISQISNGVQYALPEFCLVMVGFVVLLSSVSILGFKLRSRFEV